MSRFHQGQRQHYSLKAVVTTFTCSAGGTTCAPGFSLTNGDSSTLLYVQKAHSNDMKVFSWNCEQNAWLKANRGISFEEIIFHIELDDELAITHHPNQSKYPGQNISNVQVEDYVYLVPFVESKDEIFLKTIIPSRKATKQYLGGTP